MLVLGIESSCDETAAAVVESGVRVLSSVVSSQIEKHKPFGGVIPEIAAREHLSNIGLIVNEALRDAGLKLADVDAISVAQGPGLIGSLLVGASFAKGLAFKADIPLIPVNHVIGHIYGALLGLADQDVISKEIFPVLALVVSGGHTNLYIMNSSVEHRLLAHSVDDACGEAFDKVAKLFGYSYPGGPEIERVAATWQKELIKMPKMVAKKSDLFFSYSGLKTAVMNTWLKTAPESRGSLIPQLAASFQEAAFDQIIRKIKIFFESSLTPKSILVAGGVAANKRLAALLKTEFPNTQLLLPHPAYCSDNAAMIASYGYFLAKEKGLEPFRKNNDWSCFSRYVFQ